MADRIPPYEVSKIREKAEEAAGQVLDAYWDLNKFPVDPFAIAEEYGAEVHRADLPEDYEGLFRPAGQQYRRPQIWIDTDVSYNRQRFSCAHELGHLVEDGETTQIDRRRDSISSEGTDPHEIYANAFAAELLMPGYVVRRLRKLRAPTTELARFFGVSGVAMQNRLKNLGMA